KLAGHDQTLSLSAFVLAACRAFGWGAFARELRLRLTALPNEQAPWPVRERQGVPPRHLEWRPRVFLAKAAGPDRTSLANELCALAVAGFCGQPPSRPVHSWPGIRHRPSVPEASVPLLLKALAATGRDEDLARVIQYVERASAIFSLDDCQ